MELLKFHDIIFINEHWLQKKDLGNVASIYGQNNYCTYLKSSIDPMSTLLGRPYGGVGFEGQALLLLLLLFVLLFPTVLLFHAHINIHWFCSCEMTDSHTLGLHVNFHDELQK